MTLLNMKSLIKALTGTFLGAALLVSQSASAVIIEYELTSLGGNSYQYDYTVTNDDLVAGLELFSILFDETLTENLVFVAGPLDWDIVVLQPEPLLPFPGIYDALALGSPIALGETLSGFSVSFDWLGTGGAEPGEQLFELFDANFAFLGDGLTIAAPPPPPPQGITVPSVFYLLILGLMALAMGKKRVNH